ncbi:hypothetical protein [Streptacidiphilus carbonis]|uniref:hypothetical protein n=1 Tax=Streptacidiphilus carbonis TaxID=105422 RepID=UPI0005AA2F8A|nr:hypothetical protein [Streptacidiphilus carbonis]
MTHQDEVNLAQIADMAAVTRAAVVNWRRLHGGLDATGGTDQSPRFPRATAEQWLRDLGKLPAPAPERLPATVAFTAGPTITVYGAELHRPALAYSGGSAYEEFNGHIDPGQHDVPWPTASVRIEQPGNGAYEATDARVDISSYGGHYDFLKLVWPAGRGRALPETTETTEVQA